MRFCPRRYRLKVLVTAEFIQKGLVRSITHDPICLAIKQAVKNKYNFDARVMVPCRDYVFIDRMIFELPQNAQDLIRDLDNGRAVTPIIFELPDFNEEMFAK
jgi:hypothetical protein